MLNNVGVDRHFVLEVKPLGGRFGLEAPDEPFVGDVVLLALPALIEQGDPDHDDYAVQDAEWRGEELAPFTTLLHRLYDHSNTETRANDGDRNEPARVMNQPGEVKAELLAIVVSDEVERLHIIQETLQDHTVRQSPAIFHPRFVDQFALGHMDGEVI